MKNPNNSKKVTGKKHKKTKRKSRNKNIALFLTVVTVTVFISLATVVGFINNKTPITASENLDKNNSQIANNLTNNDTIYNNIFVGGIDVGNMTVGDALKKINDKYNELYKTKEIKIAYLDNVNTYTFENFNVKYDFKNAVDKAYEYGKKGNEQTKEEDILKLDEKPLNIDEKPDFTYDNAKVLDILNNIAKEINKEPIDATTTRKDGQFVITESQNGKIADIPAATTDLENLLKNDEEGTVTINYEEVEPIYTTEMFKSAETLIGSFSSNFSGSRDLPRNINLLNASEKLNGSIIFPGDIFSTNEAFGEMSFDNGYREAGTIIGGKIENSFGGGVCQVSSSLYDALLHAELKITTRTNHSLKVGYSDWGFDATLAGDYIDLKFQNDTDYPVYIESIITDDDKVVVNLYGHEVHDSGRTLEFENALVDTISPGPEVVKEDPTLPKGERLEDSPAKNGYIYEVYKMIYDNGELVDKVKVNKSVYKAAPAQVRIGTGGAVTTEAPVIVEATKAPVVETVAPIVTEVVTKAPKTEVPETESPAPIVTDVPVEPETPEVVDEVVDDNPVQFNENN